MTTIPGASAPALLRCSATSATRASVSQISRPRNPRLRTSLFHWCGELEVPIIVAEALFIGTSSSMPHQQSKFGSAPLVSKFASEEPREHANFETGALLVKAP